MPRGKSRGSTISWRDRADLQRGGYLPEEIPYEREQSDWTPQKKKPNTLAWEKDCPTGPEDRPNYPGQKGGEISPNGCFKWAAPFLSKKTGQMTKGFWASTKKKGAASSRQAPQKSKKRVRFADEQQQVDYSGGDPYAAYARGAPPSQYGRECNHGKPCGRTCIKRDWKCNTPQQAVRMPPIQRGAQGGGGSYGSDADYLAYKFPQPPTKYGKQCNHGFPCGRTCVSAKRIANCRFDNAALYQ